jgi:DNA-binding CsgD family transcriptional regulator
MYCEFAMYFIKILPWFLFFVSGVVSGQYPLDSLLRQLDIAIENHQTYSGQKEERIQALKKQLYSVPKNTTEEYRLNAELYDEYRPYICDSALYYKNRNIDIAKHLDDIDRLYESKLHLAYLMGSTGMYMEAVDLINTIRRDKLPEHLLVDYYNTYKHVHSELAFYTQDKNGAEGYWQVSNRYSDSLNSVLTPGDELYYMLKEDSLRNSDRFNEALKINDINLAKYPVGTRGLAIASYNRSLTCRESGDRDGEKYYLALSALSDILSATKDHASLWMLAGILYDEGDMERAYNYIRFSWSETVFYNARLRSLQSAGILSLIDLTYQATIEKKNRQLQNYLLLSGTLGFLLAIAFVYIYSQMKRLSVTRKYLQEANTNLKQLNDELQVVNEQLQVVNTDLSESNHIKEEYIGHFIKLCSTYIDKMDGFRRMVNKKLTGGQMVELLDITRSHEMMDNEIEELYTNFDKAFLRIFPHFVEKVNELLVDDEKIVLKGNELLNAELRILALIRLGISNSSQIADFLRYSVNTIYNYRAKVKNRAVSREEFEDLLVLIK